MIIFRQVGFRTNHPLIMTNDDIRQKYEAFGRIAGFGRDPGGFAETSRGGKLFAEMATLVEAMDQQGAGKLSGTGRYAGGSDSKRYWLGEIKEDLAPIRDTAAAIAEAEDTPDFDDQFRLPRGTNAYGPWITAARQFLADATPHKALFVEFEMPADFLEDLAEDIANFEAAKDEQEAGRSGQVGGTASLDVLAAQGMKVRKQLDAIVRNKYRGNAGVLAAWETAQDIAWRRRERRAAPTTPPA